MSGYLHFQRTGVQAIDDILAAIEYAGGLFHHTEHWSEGWPGPADPSAVERIQEAANRAAASSTVGRAERGPVAGRGA